MGSAETRKGFIQVNVTGQSPQGWAELHSKLLASLARVLDRITDGSGAQWFEEQAAQFSKALIDYAKARLAKPGIENEKTMAEIADLYANREKKVAETRRIHAEADAKELENALRRLRLALGVTKGMLVGAEGQEAIVMGKQVEGLLLAIREVLPEAQSGPPIQPQPCRAASGRLNGCSPGAPFGQSAPRTSWLAAFSRGAISPPRAPRGASPFLTFGRPLLARDRFLKRSPGATPPCPALAARTKTSPPAHH